MKLILYLKYLKLIWLGWGYIGPSATDRVLEASLLSPVVALWEGCGRGELRERSGVTGALRRPSKARFLGRYESNPAFKNWSGFTAVPCWTPCLQKSKLVSNPLMRDDNSSVLGSEESYPGVLWAPFLASSVELAFEQRKRVRKNREQGNCQVWGVTEQRFRDGTRLKCVEGSSSISVLSWQRRCSPASKSNFKVIQTLRCSRIFSDGLKRDWKQTECSLVGHWMNGVRSIYN